MNSDATLRELLLGARTASLGTLHEGEPFVSMVPFAVFGGGRGFVIHVSGLASHTRDLEADPRVSLMIAAADDGEAPAQALPRVTVQARAVTLEADGPGYDLAKSAYLERFPQAAPLFGFADFRLVAIRPLSLRLVAGFGQAATLGPEALEAALGEA